MSKYDSIGVLIGCSLPSDYDHVNNNNNTVTSCTSSNGSGGTVSNGGASSGGNSANNVSSLDCLSHIVDRIAPTDALLNQNTLPS